MYNLWHIERIMFGNQGYMLKSHLGKGSLETVSVTSWVSFLLIQSLELKHRRVFLLFSFFPHSQVQCPVSMLPDVHTCPQCKGMIKAFLGMCLGNCHLNAQRDQALKLQKGVWITQLQQPWISWGVHIFSTIKSPRCLILSFCTCTEVLSLSSWTCYSCLIAVSI